MLSTCSFGRNLSSALLLLVLISSQSFATAQVGNPGDVLNPNQASAEELLALPHITAELAASIVEGRIHNNMLEFNTFLSS